ncbi:MAG: bifunctional DNA-binding transcriptional regulator/O6-methylguanine-DNA methyltransferase Ada [Acidobacteria bacterium]|nr:bifunctional DNA-binding transcriptional regulator/O6-methylguanine-DNA methyltransferase Ada [Acidobacteriota bacterium]MBI3425268.1 bifunctional DNA-binding transcriptional regulator/O6-methylguanine-DNA methyltransferase Ada [Acidobacteriota bacterium]
MSTQLTQAGASTLDEAHCWQAVQTRAAQFDGLFYYGVHTTGVYCRPSCASRQPKRENVRFYALPEAARAAGLRACKRCKPDAVELCDPQAALVRGVCRLLETALDQTPDLAELSGNLAVSRFHLQRLFKKLMGITPRQYAEAQRTTRFKEHLKTGASVSVATYAAGYGSSSRLYEKAAAQLGMTPAVYRKGGQGMQINYTTTECPLGWLLVAATTKGICAITLGDAPEQLQRDLAAEFPQAEITADHTVLQTHVAALLAHLHGQLPHPDLPLDVRGTAFQKRVWEELRRIPYGETVSYGEVARRLDQPSATRAVARACATNPAALVTPCHRVIRESGELSGYRWGIERKKALLTQEKALRK